MSKRRQNDVIIALHARWVWILTSDLCDYSTGTACVNMNHKNGLTGAKLLKVRTHLVQSVTSALYHMEASRVTTKSNPMVYGNLYLPGWGQSHIFRTCSGKPVVPFFRKRSDFSGHQSWNVWWWFCKRRWTHDTCFSLFLMSYSL